MVILPHIARPKYRSRCSFVNYPLPLMCSFVILFFCKSPYHSDQSVRNSATNTLCSCLDCSIRRSTDKCWPHYCAIKPALWQRIQLTCLHYALCPTFHDSVRAIRINVLMDLDQRPPPPTDISIPHCVWLTGHQVGPARPDTHLPTEKPLTQFLSS